MLSFAHRVAGGLAAYLDGLGISSWDEWGDGPTPYTAETEWPTVIGPSFPPTPDRLVVITPTTQTRRRATVMQGIQIRLRGSASTIDSEPDPREVHTQGQRILDALYPNGFPLVHVTLGDVRVGAVLFANTLPIDPDSSGRHGLILNVTMRAIHTPSTPPAPSYEYNLQQIETLDEYEAIEQPDPNTIYVITNEGD